jgi:hypothetical protein
VAVLSLIGMVGLVVTTILGFEEPNTLMFWAFGAASFVAPAAILVHLSITRALTDDEKRIWLKEFRSPRIWSALSEYLSSTNLSESARRRVQEKQT